MTYCHSELRWCSLTKQAVISLEFNNTVDFDYCICRFGLLLTFLPALAALLNINGDYFTDLGIIVKIWYTVLVLQ